MKVSMWIPEGKLEKAARLLKTERGVTKNIKNRETRQEVGSALDKAGSWV